MGLPMCAHVQAHTFWACLCANMSRCIYYAPADVRTCPGAYIMGLPMCTHVQVHTLWACLCAHMSRSIHYAPADVRTCLGAYILGLPMCAHVQVHTLWACLCAHMSRRIHSGPAYVRTCLGAYIMGLPMCAHVQAHSFAFVAIPRALCFTFHENEHNAIRSTHATTPMLSCDTASHCHAARLQDRVCLCVCLSLLRTTDLSRRSNRCHKQGSDDRVTLLCVPLLHLV
jgi:hypothetical protein